MGKLSAALELRHLAYFVVAFQTQGLNSAADALGVAHSTLSAALHKLEGVVGLPLFSRQKGRLYPTEHALWLFRNALLLLKLEEFSRLDMKSGVERSTWVRIDLPIRFMGGRLTRAISLAILQTMRQHPNVLVWPNFIDDFSHPTLKDIPEWQPGTACAGVARIFYPDTAGKSHGVVLATERWVVIHQRTGKAGRAAMRPIGSDDLRERTLAVPNLPKPLMAQTARYCRHHKIKLSFWTGDLLTPFAKRRPKALEDFALLLPESLVDSRLGDLPIDIRPLSPHLTSTIMAKISKPHPAVESFVQRLTELMKRDVPLLSFTPEVTLRQLRYFKGLAASPSLSAAARKLNIVQPALTMQLKQLEAKCGGQLVKRQSRAGQDIVLTPIGRRMAEVSEWSGGVIETMERQFIALSAHTQQSLRLGILPSADRASRMLQSVGQAVEAWRSRFPSVPLEIVEAQHEALVASLRQHALHIALLETAAAALKQVPLTVGEPLGVVSHPRFRLLPAGPVAFARLEHLPLILQRSGAGIRMVLDEAAAALGLRLEPMIQSDSIPLNLKMIGDVPYATILPESAVQAYVRAGDLRFCPIEKPALERRMVMAYAQDRALSTAEQTLVRLLQDAFARAT